jgi:hypothetical protein
MSKVYSFRLDENNPREAKAKETIDTWLEKGYSLRYIVAEALLKYPDENSNGRNLDHVLERLELLAKSFQNQVVTEKPRQEGAPTLSSSFIASVKESVKEGIRKT